MAETQTEEDSNRISCKHTMHYTKTLYWGCVIKN